MIQLSMCRGDRVVALIGFTREGVCFLRDAGVSLQAVTVTGVTVG